MPIQFYRKPNDKNLYEVGSNRVIGATEFGIGTPNAGKGFQEIAAPEVAPIGSDQLKAMAKSVGEAGLGVNDYTKIAIASSALSKEEQDKINSDLVIPGLESTAFALPSQSTEQLYSAKYGELGLANLKTKIADLEAQITAKKNTLNEAIGKVSENPWLDEASRVGRVKRLTELANADISNVNDQYTNLKDLYNSGVDEINNYVVRSTTDFSNEKTNNATKLNYLLKKAEDQIKTAQADKTSKVYRYIPDYLQAYQSSAKGTKLTTKTVKVGTGASAKTYLITYDASGKETKRELVGNTNPIAPANPIKPVDPEIDTLAKAYNAGEKLGNVGATKKAKILDRAKELKKEEAMANRPKTAEAVQNIIKGAFADGYSDVDIINSLVEDFDFKKDVATRLVSINK